MFVRGNLDPHSREPLIVHSNATVTDASCHQFVTCTLHATYTAAPSRCIESYRGIPSSVTTMSASDSDLSEVSKTPAPPDNELEKALRREVVAAQKNEVDFSYKYIRTAAETKLGLTPGFYKNHEDWNQRSKGIIDEQMVQFKLLTLSTSCTTANVRSRISIQRRRALPRSRSQRRPRNHLRSASLARKSRLRRRDRRL